MKITKTKKQVTILYISTLLGTFLGMLVSILNTRSLNPSDFGDFKYVNNLISFFSGILLFGYFVSGSRLLALAKDERENRELKGGLVSILCTTIIIMMLIMIICGVVHTNIMGKVFGPLFYLAIPVCGSTICLNYINTSSQGDNSIMTIAAARTLPQIFFLIIGFIVFQCFGATSGRMLLLNNGIYLVVLLALIFLNHPSFHNLKESLHKLNNENKQYGLQVYYGSLAGVTVPYIAGITLGAISLDNAVVGYYTLALTISEPLAMLPQVIGTTYFKQFASIASIPKKVTLSTWAMSGCTLVAFIALIYPLVSFIYSDVYIKVAVYASYLALGTTIHGIGDVYNRFLGAHGQGKALKYGAWASGAVSVVGYTFGVYFYGIDGALATRVLEGFVYFLMMFMSYKKFIKRTKNDN